MFKINQDDIARTTCVQREIKNNHCQGACQLKKQLKQAEEQEETQIPNILKEKIETLYDNRWEKLELESKVLSTSQILIPSYYICFYFFSYIKDVFHPPTSTII